MQNSTTFDEFESELKAAAGAFARETWEQLVAAESAGRPDVWMRKNGSAFLRQVLGRALTARSERFTIQGPCSCGGSVEFRQRKPVTLHTILPGRDVSVSARNGGCATCGKGTFPLLVQLEIDAEGFTPELRDLALLAATMEPYESAAEKLLGRFADVAVSRGKMSKLVAVRGEQAKSYLLQMSPPPPATDPDQRQHYAMMDGGMLHVDRRWQECKLATFFTADARAAVSKDRHVLTEKRVLGVRGSPEDLEKLIKKHAEVVTAATLPVVCLADGSPWIWNLFAELFPERVEILDWFHLDEHVAKTANIIKGQGSEEAARWRALQLERFMHDEVEHVLEALRFERRSTPSESHQAAIDELEHYLTTHRHRVNYGTYRQRGLLIGSGAIESAISHVAQQRMKRSGMRWSGKGADAMLALRCIYRSTGHWENFLGAPTTIRASVAA